jgi:formylglycine-generating enzyme required for sulfatase activity
VSIAALWMLAPAGASDALRGDATASLPATVENGLGMRFALVPPGTLMVGAPGGGAPSRILRMPRPLYVAVHEVTNEQYAAFGGEGPDASDPPAERGAEPELGRIVSTAPGRPAGFVSWRQAHGFAEWLSAREARRYRLPTDVEWEYACRAGMPTAYWWGDALDQTGRVANVADRKFQATYPQLVSIMPMDDGFALSAPVGAFRPNALGLFDMIGNVWEWVDAADDDATGPRRASRTAMGGAFASGPDRARCDSRLEVPPIYRYATTGFRLVLEPESVTRR